MNKVVRKYRFILQTLIMILPIIWMFNYANDVVKNTLYAFTFALILFTLFLAFLTNWCKKTFYRYILMTIYMIVIIIAFDIYSRGMDFNFAIKLLSLIILPLGLITINDVKISDRSLGFILITTGIVSLFNIGSVEFIKNLAIVILPVSILIIYNERNLIVKLLYVLSTIPILNIYISEYYIIALIVLVELIILAFGNKYKNKDIEQLYMFLYIINIILISIDFLDVPLPVALLMAVIASKGYIKEKQSILFTAYNLSIGGIETSLVNLLNEIDKDKYVVTLILEEKKGLLLNKVDKRVNVIGYKVYNKGLIGRALNLFNRMVYSFYNYNTYDFSCCYATYSYCGNLLAKISSTNSSIWVHSNYKYAYKRIEDVLEFFDTRKLDDFRRIVFVSNESERDYLDMYPRHTGKTLVINNLVDIKSILAKKKEKVEITHDKNKKLFVFVGRLDESSKKLTRLLDIAKNVKDIEIWIIGDGKDKKMYQDIIDRDNLEDRVSMLGSIKEPFNYMNEADYIILTSDYEGFPVVYLEALVLGKEIISTIPVSDEKLDFNKMAHIISKDNYVEDIKKILKKNDSKIDKVNMKEIQKDRIKKLEKLFEGGI